MKNRPRQGAPPRAAFRIHPQIENEQPLAGSLIFWWRRMDSNHRRRSQQIYSLSPLATWVLLHIQLEVELVDGFEPPTC